MNVMLESTLPPAPVGEAAQRRHGSWRQAMEQAQLAEWFQPGRERAAGDEPHAARTEVAVREPLRRPQARELGLRHALGRNEPEEGQAPAQAQEHPRGGDAMPDLGAAPLPAAPRPAVQDAVPFGAERAAPTAFTAAAATDVLAAAVMAHMAPAARMAGESEARAALAPAETANPPPLRPLQGLPPSRALPAERVATESLAPVSAPQRPAAAEPPPPVRVHVDWQGHAAHVWLGLDREQLPNLPGLLRQLEQRLQAAGLRLASVTCNGRAVYPRPTSGGEQ